MRRITVLQCLLFLASPALAFADEPAAVSTPREDAADQASNPPLSDAAPRDEVAPDDAASGDDDSDAPAAPPEPSASETTDAAANTLREAHEDLDALTSKLLNEAPEPDDSAPSPLQLELVPPSMSSETPEALPEADPKRDLSWLDGIELPDIPVRWHAVLLDQLAYYRDDPRGRSHIRNWLQRAGAYEAMIRPKLHDAGVPEDLLYVAMVESGYNPLVESSAGASGMWQMVETTARDYGLEKNRFIDQRRSPEHATVAAAQYLKDLHTKLGSWPLALAAYNMGYGAMLRSIRKYNTNDFWLLARLEAGLPYETVAYVAKVMACAVIAHNPERFGLGDLKPDAPVATAEVTAPGGTGLGRVASAAGIPVDALAALNPELLRKRLPPDVKQWTLRIPSDKVERFTRHIAAQKDEPKSHAMHVLRFGERAKDVAEMYGTTERKLRALNDLSDEDSIRPGMRLIVPDVEPLVPAHAEDKVVVGVPEHTFAYPDCKHIFYVVQKDDDTAQIAAFFKVSVDQILRWNAVSTDASLQPGMTLQMFVPASVDLTQAVYLPEERVQPLVVGSREFFSYHEALRDRTRVHYRVRKGDTLGSLADRYDLSVGSIARINRFGASHALPVDSEIILYVPNKDAAKFDNDTRQSSRD